jgi:hypothetical protein
MDFNFLIFPGAKGVVKNKINESDLLWVPLSD